MKKLILIIIALTIIVSTPSCNLNGKATLIVKNVGELSISARVERAEVQLNPGEEEHFVMTWPGKKDMNSNLSIYAIAYRETMWENTNFWIKNGETKLLEVGFDRPEITK